MSGYLFGGLSVFGLYCLFFGKPKFPGLPAWFTQGGAYAKGVAFGREHDGDPPRMILAGESEDVRSRFMAGVRAAQARRHAA